MKRLLFTIFAGVLLGVSINAQTAATAAGSPSPTPAQAAETTKPKKQIFRANKAQISMVQKMLKEKGLYYI